MSLVSEGFNTETLPKLHRSVTETGINARLPLARECLLKLLSMASVRS